MTRARRFVAIALLLFLWIPCGCSRLNNGPYFGPQGTIGMQRNRNVLHDPFPSNDLGPPIVSGRPLGFEQPWAENRSIQSNALKRPRR